MKMKLVTKCPKILIWQSSLSLIYPENLTSLQKVSLITCPL